MNKDQQELIVLIHDCLDGHATDEQTARLNVLLRTDAAARDVYLQLADVHSCLAVDEALWFGIGTDTVPPASFRTTSRQRWRQWRPLTAAAAGLVFGMFCTSLAWAFSTPKATTERLFSLANGSFDERQLEAGFPRQTGLWSGDEAAITGSKLRFINPGSDANDSSARAISCDVFQLVDLSPLRATLNQKGDSVLELSANFLDARPYNTKPSVTLFCQIYLFKGDPTVLHRTWPQAITEALSSGSAQITTLGSSKVEWNTLTAKSLVPADADFAVIQVAARPNQRPAKLESVFADDVRLTLKTQPNLPVRIVQK